MSREDAVWFQKKRGSARSAIVPILPLKAEMPAMHPHVQSHNESSPAGPIQLKSVRCNVWVRS